MKKKQHFADRQWSGIKKLIIVMKLTAFFLFLSGMAIAAGTYGQGTRFDLNVKDATIIQLFDEIEHVTEFGFLFKTDQLDLNRHYTLDLKKANIDQILNEVLDKNLYNYTVIDRNIVITLVDGNAPQDGKSKTVTGKVTDSSGASLPGVTVVVKGTTAGVITDVNGSYSLSNIPANATLQFSFVGMKALEIEIGVKTSINVVMTEEAIGLEEVVAIGYGTIRKRDLTGSVSSFKVSEIENERPKDLQQLLRSNVAGLNIGMSTSAKGGGSIEIRGRTSLKTESSPLIVLDGVIYVGDLSDINPNDIESVDVLKDASSSAVYGSKSANGVIILNSKKGKSAKPIIGVDINLGMASLLRSEDVYSPTEFMNWRVDVLNSIHRSAPPYMYNDPRNLPSNVTPEQWLAYDNSKGDLVDVWLRRLSFSNPEVANYKADKSTNWKNMVFRTGLEQNYNFNLSGKTDLLSYYWSLGYTNNEGVVVNDDYSVYRSRLRLEAKVTNYFTVGLNTLFSIRDESGTPVNWQMYDNISPWGQSTNADGSYKIYPTDDGVAAYHPLIDSYYTEKKYTYKSLDNVLFAKITLPFNIIYELNYSPRFTNNEFFLHQSSDHPEWGLVGGKASRNTSNSFSWQVDNILKWKKTIKDNHNIDITLLVNSEKNQSWSQNMSNQNFVPSDVLGYHFIGSGGVPTISSNDTYSTGDAFMARMFYSYKSKYLFTGTVRRDGYSAFGMMNPRATFPSLALGWVFTEEPFLKTSWLNSGKMRLSWGGNGNRSIGIYDALSAMSNNMITYANPTTGALYQKSYLDVYRMGNGALKWEKTNSFNLGFDLSFFGDALNATVDLYSMSTKDLLVDRSLPAVTGYSSVATNLGEVGNKGIEFSINSTNIKTTNFSWNTSFNFSLNRNKIVSLYGDMVDVYDNAGNIVGQREVDDIKNKWFIGHAIDEIWDYNVIGVWQKGEEVEAAKYKLAPGDFKLKDVNGDYIFNNNDKEFLGFTKPRFRWNLRNEINLYKNFDFSFSIYSNWGQKREFNEATNNPTMSLDRFNSFKIPYWTENNPINDFARLNSSLGGVQFNVWRDLSFIRLDNISMSYSIPDKLLQKYNIQRLKLVLTARNVAVWTKGKILWDPEYAGPTPSYVTLGINLAL